ncbi:MAG: pentapeptide repeat-containing protein [Anaerolineales bacterium]|nr:pentapeptide repeat-containing protein [Anaerolineales bacterium]
MNDVSQLVLKVHSTDNNVAIRAVDRLREQGWLGQGVLARTNMRYVHLQRADLHKANLEKIDLSMADLRWSNMSWANLKRANLNKANLYGANLHMADLEGANLIRAKLQSVCNFSEDQLRKTNRMRFAIMPDGSLYNGSFHLPGDLESAQAHHVNLDNPIELDQFYGVHIPRPTEKTYDQVTKLMSRTDSQLVRMLRKSDHEIVLQAVYELRRRGRLNGSLLEWTSLKFVHLQGANLSSTNFRKADLSMADLQGANLSHANLEGTRLNKADMRGCDLRMANLKDAQMSGVNIQGACNITDNQLSKVSMMRGATMTDGNRYDGRFNLTGDLWALRSWRIDSNDPEAVADFFSVSLDDYLLGQQLISEKLPISWFEACGSKNRFGAESLLSNLSDHNPYFLNSGCNIRKFISFIDLRCT